MTDRPTSSTDGEHVYDRRIVARFAELTRGFWTQHGFLLAWGLTFGLMAVLLANVGVQLAVNTWNGWFFNALERRDAATAGQAVLVFGGLVCVVAAVGVGIVWFRETLQVHWRAWVTRSLMDRWFAGNAFQRLGETGIEPANPEYRIADDVRMALEPIVDFAIGLFSAVLAFVTFVGVLWAVGGALSVSGVTIPAYMVIGAIVYGVVASTLMILFGKPLVPRIGARNEAEAALRFSLTDTRTGARQITASGGEGARREHLDRTYDTVRDRWLAVVRQNAKLTWITNGSGALIPVVPLLLAAPKYFAGELTLGAVVQLAAAFVQVQLAISWIVDNYRRIAECYASVRRVVELERAITSIAPPPPPGASPLKESATAFLGRSRSFARRAVDAISATPGHRSALLAALGLVSLVWAVAVWQWVGNDLVVPWDSKNQFYAFFRFMASAIHAGASPFWNPFHYAGHPSIADPQSLVFQPAFILWAYLDRAPSLIAFDVIVFGHLLAGGLGVAVYGHRHRWPVAASVLAAVVFMFGGAAAGRANHTGILTAYAMFPIALVLLEVALDRRSILAALGFAVAASLIALGRAQVPFLLCLMLVAAAIHHVAARPAPLAYLRQRLAVFAVMATACVALLAVPILLTVQFAILSNRPIAGLDATLMNSLYPVNFANMFVPNVFGSLWSPTGDWGPGQGTRPGLDHTDRAFNYLFAGSLTALLLVWHGIAGGRMFARGRRFLTIVAVFACVYAVGRYTPIFPLMFEWIPAIGLFRRPNDATFVLLIATSLIVGHLVADFVRHGLPRIPLWRLATALTVVAALLIWAVGFSAGSSRAVEAMIEIAKVAPIYLALIALLAFARSKRARVAAATVAVLLTSGEIVWRNAASALNAEPRAVYSVLERPTGEAARIVETIEREVARHSTGVARPRVEIVGLGGAWQNAAMVLGFEATNGYNPLRIGAYDRLVSPGESPYTTHHRRFPISFPGYDCALSRLLGLEYVVLDRPIEQMPHLRRRPVADVIMAGPVAWIYRLRDAVPRVKLSTRVRVADADAYVDAGQFLNTVPQGEVFVDDDDELSNAFDRPRSGEPGRAEIVSWRPDRMEIAVETRTTAILSVQALWYPGWEVEVDGERRPVLRTNILFRGVEVPPGARRVVFTFRPLTLENLWSVVETIMEPNTPEPLPAPQLDQVVNVPQRVSALDQVPGSR